MMVVCEYHFYIILQVNTRYDSHMKRLLFVVLTVLSLSACGTPSLRVGSFNLWRSDLGKGDYEWTTRKHRLVNAISDIGFDLFGAQEVDTTIIRELPVLLKEAGLDYEMFIFSPYEQDGGTGNKAQALFYNPKRLEILEDHHFWFSPTPDVISGGWDEIKFKRGGFCVIFEDLKTGVRFFFMHSHMPLGKEANLHAATIINEKARQYNPENLPAIFVGDLNTRPETPSSNVLRTYWSDICLVLPADRKSGPHGTFNSHDVQKDMETAARIDYIYTRGESVVPLNYYCDTRTYEGLYPSDHCPVYSDIRISKQ